MIKYKYVLALLLLIIASFSCQLCQIDRDFDGHHEFSAVHQSLMAQNLIKHGALKTKLGPVINTNPLNNKFLYYLYHPFLSNYIYAILFGIFGSSIVTARVISMLFLYLSVACFYFLLKTLWSEKIALWGCFFYMFFPISQYFSKLVGSLNIVMSLMFLFVLFYFLWARDKKDFHFNLMFTFSMLACATAWVGYFLAPIAIAHYRYGLKNKSNKIFFLLLGSVGLLSVVLLYNFFLTGSFGAPQSQWPSQVFSSENLGLIKHVMATRMDFSLLFSGFYYKTIFSYAVLSFSLPAILLISYFLFNYQKYKYLRAPTIYIFFIGFIYFLYGLPQPKALSDHDFWAYLLSGTFAAACALVISKARRLHQVMFVVVFLLFSTANTSALYNMNNTNQINLMLGKIIPLISEKEDGIALSKPYYSPYIEYFGQRKILYDVTTWERLAQMIDSGKIDYFVTDFSRFKSEMVKRFPATFLPNGHVAFDLKLEGIKPAKAYTVFFSNNISLVNHSFEKLNDNYILLNYVWQKYGPLINQDKVFVHFNDINDGSYPLGQDHYLLNGLKSNNQLITETFVVKIPEHVKGKKLNIFIGFYSSTNGSRAVPLNRKTSDRRVFLEQIQL